MNKYVEDSQDYVCSISPSEFEEFCMELLKIYAKEEKLSDFHIDHDVKIEGSDGKYQIDVYASFTAIGVKFQVLCECKQYTSSVKRERVELLESRLKSLGMHKGILLSTSGFQSGAVNYAKAHGIALIQVFDHSCIGVSHSGGPEVVTNEEDPFQYIENHWPSYRAVYYTERRETPKVLYPTKEITSAIFEESKKLIKGQYGFEFILPEFESEQEP